MFHFAVRILSKVTSVLACAVPWATAGSGTPAPAGDPPSPGRELRMTFGKVHPRTLGGESDAVGIRHWDCDTHQHLATLPTPVKSGRANPVLPLRAAAFLFLKPHVCL